MKDRRKYPRIYLQENEILKPIVGAKADFGNAEIHVFDMSYSGLALAKCESIKVEAGEEIAITLNLGEKKIPLSGEVRWVTDKLFGMQISGLGERERLHLMRFVEEKVLGTYVSPVAKELFSRQTFDQWYHGPYDTNIYIWEVAGEFKKAIIELDGNLMCVEDNEFSLLKNISPQVEETEYNYYLQEENERESLKSENPVSLRAIEVLSQIENKTNSLDALLEKLVEFSG